MAAWPLNRRPSLLIQHHQLLHRYGDRAVRGLLYQVRAAAVIVAGHKHGARHPAHLLRIDPLGADARFVVGGTGETGKSPVYVARTGARVSTTDEAQSDQSRSQRLPHL